MDHSQGTPNYEALARLPDNNPGPVFQLTLDGDILLANKVARTLLKIKGVEGNNFIDLVPELDRKTFSKIIQEGEPYRFETIVGPCNFIFTFVRPEGEKVIFCYGNDVTEVREAQEKIAEQAAILKEYARFPEMNPGPVFRLGVEGNVILANQASRNIFGELVIGTNWMEIFPGMNSSIWKEILIATEPYLLEAQVGPCVFLFYHRMDPVSNLVFVYGSDITLQKKAERAIGQSEKLATLGTLAAGIAHELNNPAAATKRAASQLRQAFGDLEEAHLLLGALEFSDEGVEIMKQMEEDSVKMSSMVIGMDMDPMKRSDLEAEFEQMLDDFGVDDSWKIAPSLVNMKITQEQVKNYEKVFGRKNLSAILKWKSSAFQVYSLVNEIGHGSGRISEIVSALKNYAYLGQAPLQSINIHEGLDNTLVILRNKMKKGVNVIREYSEGLPQIFAYGSELNQAWTNLLDNATDAMKGMGTIIIRTYPEKNCVVVEIEDNGPGIPPGVKERIFDPFFTTKEPGKGTGLGLSTTYGIITEKHKGTIQVESVPGKTKFIIKIPVGSSPEINIEKN